MNKIAAIGLVLGACATLGGCFGYVQEGEEVDMGGYIGRIENNPPEMDGWLGESSSRANWSKRPMLKRNDLHAYGDDEYVLRQRAEKSADKTAADRATAEKAAREKAAADKAAADKAAAEKAASEKKEE